MFVDLHGEELMAYRSSQVDPPDFDSFWQDTLASSRELATGVRYTSYASPLTTLDVYDVSFSGYGGQRVSAWLRVPRGTAGPLPTVVEFVGYGGGRGLAEDWLFWPSCGYAHLHVDARGQGAGWSVGDTPDDWPSGPRVAGFMTAGLGHRDNYYYRRLITDSVLAIDAAAELPLVDESKITALGTSQGGGLALATAALSGDVASLVAYVPFLCDFPRAIAVTDAEPYREISRFLAVHRHRELEVLATLQYFDGVNFAKRSTAPAAFTTGLMDDISPPSTVLAAYHAYAGPKTIKVWNHNGHEGGGRHDDLRIAQDLKSGWMS